MSLPSPQEALGRLLERIEPVDAEPDAPDPTAAGGRVLAAPLRLDRDSPACDVSAMDGFAVRVAEVTGATVPVVGECRIGEPPATLPVGAAMRIYTGSPLPAGADAVLQVERAEATDGRVRLGEGQELTQGEHIRRQAENAARDALVLDAGKPLTPAAMTAAASIGFDRVRLHRPLRLAILTTGDELEPASSTEAELPPWRLRDSNGPTLEAMFARIGWVGSIERRHVIDEPEKLVTALSEAVDRCDAVVLTGGVSKGAHDHVPDAVRRSGGEVLFHRIAARPGKPVLGAVREGKPILGLPGNPVSVLCTARRLVAPALRKRAGFFEPDPTRPLVSVPSGWTKTIDLTWWRPVRLIGPGQAELCELRGSGDTCGGAASDGFVEAPPGSLGEKPLPFYGWSVD